MTESFASLFEETFASQTIKTGTIIKGTIIDIDSEFVTVSAGLKSEAIIPLSQFGSEKDGISIGEEIEVSLDSFEDGFGETKLSREITVAAKLGDKDPDMNPRLRSAIQAAKQSNMPKENISRAINKSTLTSGDNYQNLRYEGYGTFNTALIIETLTDIKLFIKDLI